MEGSSSGVYQSWVCCGVPVGSLARDCSSFLCEEGSTFWDAINACIETLKKEVADLEAIHEHLLSGVTSPSSFGD